MLQQSLAELCFLTSSEVRGKLVDTGFWAGAGAGAEPPPELAAWDTGVESARINKTIRDLIGQSYPQIFLLLAILELIITSRNYLTQLTLSLPTRESVFSVKLCDLFSK